MTARPEGHRFTLEEVAAMTVDEYAANEAALMAQLPELGEQASTRAADRRERLRRAADSKHPYRPKGTR